MDSQMNTQQLLLEYQRLQREESKVKANQFAELHKNDRLFQSLIKFQEAVFEGFEQARKDMGYYN